MFNFSHRGEADNKQSFDTEVCLGPLSSPSKYSYYAENCIILNGYGLIHLSF